MITAFEVNWLHKPTQASRPFAGTGSRLQHRDKEKFTFWWQLVECGASSGGRRLSADKGTCMRVATIIGGMATTLVLAASAAVAQPAFEWIVEPPGAANGRVADISADGQSVVGFRFVQENGTSLPGFRWQRGLGRVDYLQPTFQVSQSNSTGISSDGRVVVGEGRDVNSQVRERLYRSIDNGPIELFVMPANANRVLAGRSNGDGSKVIGLAQNVSFDGTIMTQRPVLYTGLNTVVELPLPANGVDANRAARDISADGSRIVGSVRDGSRGNRTHAVMWDSNLNASFMPVPADALNSFAFGTSRQNNFTVGMVRMADSSEQFARWQGDELITVPLPPRDATTQWSDIQPTHISNDGSIATGNLFYDAPSGGTFTAGFIWTPSTGIMLAKDYVLQLGASLPFPTNDIGVTDLVVSADGTTLAGQLGYRDAFGQGQPGSFVLTIPSSPTLGVASLLLFACVRRRRHGV